MAALFAVKFYAGRLLAHKKDIPGPLTDMRAARIEDLGAIAKVIAILIHPHRRSIVKRDCIHAKPAKQMQLARL